MRSDAARFDVLFPLLCLIAQIGFSQHDDGIGTAFPSQCQVAFYAAQAEVSVQ